MNVVISFTLQCNPPFVSCSAYKNKKNSFQKLNQRNKFVIISLTWQEVHAPVQVMEAGGGGSDDLSRFWSHLTKNLLVQTSNSYSYVRI